MVDKGNTVMCKNFQNRRDIIVYNVRIRVNQRIERENKIVLAASIGQRQTVISEEVCLPPFFELFSTCVYTFQPTSLYQYIRHNTPTSTVSIFQIRARSLISSSQANVYAAADIRLRTIELHLIPRTCSTLHLSSPSDILRPTGGYSKSNFA